MLGRCNYNQHSASATTHKSRKSKRWRTVCEQQTAEASHSFCGNDEQNSAVMANEDLLVGTASHIDNSIMGDIGNSELSKFPSISDLGKIEKMLTQCDHNQNSASATTHKSRKSKRWRTVCQQQTAEASHSLCGNDEQNSAVMVNEDLLVGTASHIDNSIMGDMPSNTISRRTRRMLRQCDRTENCAPTNVFFTSDESHQVISRKSKRWKAASQQPATEALDTFSGNHEQNVAAPINENLLVGTASHIDYSITEGQSSHSRGQASYQRTKQVLTTKWNMCSFVTCNLTSQSTRSRFVYQECGGRKNLTLTKMMVSNVFWLMNRREELRITLWGHIARQIDIETIKKLPPPVLMALTSLKIKEYLEQPAPANTSNTCIFINPTIPEAMRYRIQFSKLVDRVQVRPIPSKQPTSEEIEENDVRTVSQLNTLDPSSYKDQMVYCSATISRFATHDSWWYKGCPRCYRELKQQEHMNQLGCLQHGIQQIIPCFRVYMTIEDGDHEATFIIDVGREWIQFSRKTIKVKKRCRIKKSDWKIGNSRVIRLLAAEIFKKIWFWTFRVSRAKSQVLILNQI